METPSPTGGSRLQGRSMLLKSLHSLGFVMEKERKQNATPEFLLCQHFWKASDTFEDGARCKAGTGGPGR